MTKQFSTLIFSAITLAYLSGCGGSGEDPSIPKASMKNIIKGFKAVNGAKLNLDASSSTDDIGIVKYSWTIDKQEVSTKMIDDIDLDLGLGEHELCLIVTDADNKSKMKCEKINIVASQLGKPTVVINSLIKAEELKTKCPLTMSASQSTAGAGGEIVKYQWSLDGKVVGTKETQDFSFDTAGKYDIELKVTDNESNSETKTKTLTILEHTNPTAKMTLVNVFNVLIFSGESNEPMKVWQKDEPVPEVYTPEKSNYVFLSAEGSHDDCNLTDDNLSFKWEATIYNTNGDNQAPGGTSCFHNKGELRDRIMDFNGTQFVAIDIKDIEGHNNAPNSPDIDSRVKRNDDGTGPYYLEGIDLNNTYKYASVNVVNGSIGGNWEGWKGWRNEKWEKAYISMCAVTLDYTYLKVTLTVIDHLHDINTTVIKYVKTRYTNTTDDAGKIIDKNHPRYGQQL